MDEVIGTSRSIGDHTLSTSTNSTVMLLSQHLSQADWEAQYLLALSYLNFDHKLCLILLPNTMSSCTWDNKQWQALPLYGLGACYHLGDAPPIDSTAIDWPAMHALLTQPKQKSLHICHWKGLNHFNYWLPVVQQNDKLILFGHIDDAELTKACNLWPNSDVYVVINSDQPHISSQAKLIDHNQWAIILKQKPVTLTWN